MHVHVRPIIVEENAQLATEGQTHASKQGLTSLPSTKIGRLERFLKAMWSTARSYKTNEGISSVQVPFSQHSALTDVHCTLCSSRAKAGTLTVLFIWVIS